MAMNGAWCRCLVGGGPRVVPVPGGVGGAWCLVGEKVLPLRSGAGYGRRVGIFMSMVRVRGRAVAPGVGLASAHC